METNRRSFIRGFEGSVIFVSLRRVENLESLQEERITAREALLAYIRKALEVQENFNPITEIITVFHYYLFQDQIGIGSRRLC